ncbi:hypothetical protein LTR62_003866 [Meristemomyces frigidus]|uniref:Carbohydrate-binding-like protein n=1 Tax=Meristemomyces frigidus TaxID=1508187 RepID=A0AAN7YKB4_9PEZI|nr:hypothetical protein LTR62_003866 [Meristemomyces frigidus]
MRSFSLVALLTGAVVALPQGIDWAAVADLAPVPTASIPVVAAAAQQTTVTFVATAAAQSVSAAVQASPSDTSLKMVKRVDDSGCPASAQPASGDTATAFLSNPEFAALANGAVTPAGYSLAYSNQAGSSQGVYGYMGFSVLESYDTQTCSSLCDAVEGCSSFNIYVERDPSIDPTSSCSDPSSITVINQYREDFHVVIAGSNGYVNNSIATPAGYSGPVFLGNAAINAPLDCAGHDTYMGVKIFTAGPFDAGLCAAACSSQTQYNLAHPPTNGAAARTCQFFNTYVLYNGTGAVGQYCSLYNETWPASYATNVGGPEVEHTMVGRDTAEGMSN